MILRTYYPKCQTNKDIIITSIIVGALLYLLLIIYQPFGTSQFEHKHKYLLLIPYAIIAIFSCTFINLLLIKQNETWTFGLELLKTFIILLLISIFSYLYNSLFLSKVNLTFVNFLYMFVYTISVGLPICAIYLMSRYIYFFKINKNTSIQNVLFEKTALIGEKFIETKKHTKILNICIDEKEKCLQIDQNDFLYAEAADNYCMLYFYENGNLKKKLIRISLNKLLVNIQSDIIQRVHRSYIVNLEKVNKYKGNSSGYKILFYNIEKEISISRNYINFVLPILKNLVTRP